MIQMSALTLDWGNRASTRRPWTVICSFHREQTGEGKKRQKHPSNGHFPDQNTWILLPSHKTMAPPNWRHSSELSGQGNPKCEAPAHQKPQVPRLPEAQRFPAQLERASKAKKHSPSTSPGRRQTQGGDLSRPSPWTNQWQSGEAPQTAQAPVSVQRESRCLERPRPLHRSSQAASLRSSLLLPTLCRYGCHQPHGRQPTTST